MSATETAAAPVEEVNAVETSPVVPQVAVEAPAAETSKEEAKTEEPAPAAEATTEPIAEEGKAAESEVKRPKSPGLLAKLQDILNKVKVPKSPKKEKKKDEIEAPPAEEPVPEAVADSSTVATEEPAKAEETPADAVKETETAPTEASGEPAHEDHKEKKEDEKKARLARRLSSRVGDFFKPKAKTEVATPAKVDEHPPKIDEPAPVAPLENPATETAPAGAAAEPAPEPTAPIEEPKIEAPPVAPVVAAAA